MWIEALTWTVVGCATIAHASTQNSSGACKQLNQFTLPSVTSIRADEVTSGKLQPSTGSPITDLPPFCRVLVEVSPAQGSHINIEIWLPVQRWNGKFLGTGNGGGGAKIYYPPLRAGLRRGFATANTDLGTTPNADAAAANPEAWIDFGHRATHVMTVMSKAILMEYYGKAAQRAYFWGSSTGGQQAMSEAQRYPEDYDGIVAGSPAINRTHLHSYFVWNYQATHKVEGQSALTPDEIAALDRNVIHTCAGHDGGAPTDDFLSDPRVCHFHPATLPLCGVTATAGCLTQAKLEALNLLYAGPVNPRTRERIYAPIPPGSEASNLGLAYQETPATARQVLYPLLWAFGGGFDPMKFDFDHDEAALDDKLAAIVNANNPDLTKFRERGGKLILYTGTADPIVPYTDEIGYYERVVDFLRAHPGSGMPLDPLEAAQTFFRMYVVPGMGHGGGGPGLDSFGQLIQPTDNDVLYALERWVEQGVAPGEFPAVGWYDGVPSKGIRMRRNVCVYPAFPNYTGGDPSQASSFRCAAHPRGSVADTAPRYLR